MTFCNVSLTRHSLHLPAPVFAIILIVLSETIYVKSHSTYSTTTVVSFPCVIVSDLRHFILTSLTLIHLKAFVDKDDVYDVVDI